MSSCKKNTPPVFGRTDIGLVRRRNEDNFFCAPERGIFAVADGLGGLSRGDAASKAAVDALAKIAASATPGEPLDLNFVFAQINSAVLAAVPAGAFGQITGGTTLTLAQFVSEKQLRIGHVGDSGIFLFPKTGDARQLTHDHTVAQEKIDRFGDAIIPDISESAKNTLTRCLGQPDLLEVDTYDVSLSAGDRLLLYTDGVTKVWTLPELKKLARNAGTPTELVNEIIDTGNARGGPDNITAIAIFV